MLDMPVPGSFSNVGHNISGQEGSGYKKLCGENRRSSVKNRFTHSYRASNVDEKWSKNQDDLMPPQSAIAPQSSETVST